MKAKIFGAAIAAVASTGAMAADLPAKKAPPAMPMAVSPWDFDIGAGLTTDYIFRGVSQSNHSLSVNAHAELKYNFNDTFQGYVGIAGNSIKLTKFDPSPSMELDVYGGIRATFGKFSLDVGGWGYLYPGLQTPTANLIFPTQIHFWEAYAKLGYAITDTVNVGANYFYTPSFLNTGAWGQYVAGTVKVGLPADFAISGEFGRQFFGTTNAAHFSYKMPDYNYWNVGLSYTWKMVTFDVRYHDTNLTPFKCFQITGPTDTVVGTRSNYCDRRFVGSVSFAITGKDVAGLPGAVVAKY